MIDSQYSLRMSEVVRRNRRWVPHHACEDLFGHAPEIGTAKTCRAASRPRKKQDFAFWQQSRMHRQHTGVKSQQVPFPIPLWIVIQRQHSIESGVLPRRIVNHHHDYPRLAVAFHGRDPTSLILPSKPPRHPAPQAPATGRLSVAPDILTDFIEGLVLLDRPIDLKYEEIFIPHTIQIDYGHAYPLILPREPIRHILPCGPPTYDIPISVQLTTHAIHTSILSGWVVHHYDDQFEPPVAIKVS